MNRRKKMGKKQKKSLVLHLCVGSLISISPAIANTVNTTPTYTDSPFYPIPAYLSSGAEKVKPNVMLLLDSSGSMKNTLENKTPKDEGYSKEDSRIRFAQKIIKDLVQNNKDSIRWGYSSYYAGDFVPVTDDSISRIVKQVDVTTSFVFADQGGTPTVPRYYQMTRYFQGLPPTTSSTAHHGLYGDWSLREPAPSPIQYRCQKNFIISISDGLANDVLNTKENLDDPIFVYGGAAPGLANISDRLYLFTARAFISDFKTNPNEKDIEGGSYQDPVYPVQNIMTYTIGYGPEVDETAYSGLVKAAQLGGGIAYNAQSADQLIAALKDAITNILATSRPPVPSTYIEGGDNIISGAISVIFKSGNWSSELTVSTVNNEASGASITQSLDFPTGTDRNIWFHSPSKGVTKVTANTDTASTFGVDLPEAENILVPWLQGTSTGTANTRASLFGDVINGNISITDKGALFSLGANDGMVHVFKKNAIGGYAETFVFMPTLAKRAGNSAGNTVGKTVPMLTKSNYGQMTNVHRYLVDGGSFYRGSEGLSLGNKEFVVGATGRGGAGVYALDMKQIKASGGNKESVLFDITNNTDFSDLGYTVSTPLIAFVQDDLGNKKWVTIAANGYFSKNGISNEASGQSGLYLINLENGIDYSSGSKYKYLPTKGSDANNGLSSPTAVDTNNDGLTDYVYAGDLKGDLYRFSLKPDQTDDMYVVKIFSGDPSKPITSAPAVFKRKDGQRVIIFGTGRLLTAADNSSTEQQSVYGIIDVDDDVTSSTVAPIDATQLQKQTITESEDHVRHLSDNSLQDTNLGWTLDLAAGEGERVVYQPVIYGGTVYLTTQIVLPPKSNSLCEVGSSSGYIMSLDAETGGQPKASNSHFGEKDAADYYAGKRVQGYVSNVGGLIMAKASSVGTNTHGQLVSGMMNLNINQDSIMLNSGNDTSVCKAKPSLSYAVDKEEKIENVTAPACIKGSRIRVLSWREIF